MKAAIYCRISKDRTGAGLGVKNQEADCRALAERLGHQVVAVHTDNDLSAYSGKPRPGYRALLEDIETGLVWVVIAWHEDRLHRAPMELEHYIDVCRARGTATVFVQSGDLDLVTASGRTNARIKGNIARGEVEHMIERMQQAKRRSAEAGVWKGGRRPFGYDDDGVTIRESEARLIREAADAVLAGASVQSLARTWNAAKSTTTTGRPWSSKAPRRVLLRPRNAGLMEHQGEIVGEAKWDPIIDPEKWRAVVRVLTDPSRRTNLGSSVAQYLGSGLYLCGTCGQSATSLRAGRNRDGQQVYRCRTGAHVSRVMAPVDEYVSALVVGRLRQPDALDLLRVTTSPEDMRALESRAVELSERKNQLAAVFAEGAIDAGQLATGSRTLNAELDRVRDQMSAAYRGTSLAGIGDAPDPGQAWLDAPMDRRRAVLDLLLTVTVHASGKGRPAGWRPGDSYFRSDTVDVAWK